MSESTVSTFRAFRSRNYTLYFIGRAVSQFGTWMQRTAVVWVVYSLTHSPFILGLAVFAEQFPSFLLSVFGGVAADRYNRFKIINITQITSMIQAVLLAVLVMTNHYVIWEILTLSVILGIINAYDIPARQALINEVVEDESDLPSALSLSASMASVAKILGPALAGIILHKFDAGICFLVNAASFGGVIVSIAFMKRNGKTFVPKRKDRNAFKDLADGFDYLVQQPSIGLVIVMLGITSFFVLPYDTLLPVFAKVIFKGNAATFGYINSFIGAGAVAGTMLLASLKKNAPMRRVLVISTIVISAGLVCFSLTAHFYVAMLFAVIIGFGGVAQFTTCNIIVQSESSPEMRGRAISILLTAVFGMAPLGSLVVGWVSQHIGAPKTFLAEGITGIITAIIFATVLKRKKHDSLQLNMQAEEEMLETI